MNVLLDTDVLVDCLRGTDASRDWLRQNSTATFQVPGIVAMELLAGCRNKADLKRAQDFLNSHDMVWPEAGEFAAAYELLAQHRLASGLSIPDCLIAAMAVARSAPLYTFNVKHFRVVKGLTVQEPYQRS